MLVKKIISTVFEKWHYFNLDKLDWITKNKLVLKKHAVKSKAVDNKNPLKILCWGMTAWERGAVEHMLAYSLKLRGHEIHGVVCGGGITSCSLESAFAPRPSCEYCVERNNRLRSVFPFQEEYESMVRYLSEDEKKECELLVKDIEIEAIESFVYEGIDVGRIAIRDLPQFYFKLVDIKDEQYYQRIRDSLLGTLMYTKAALNAIETIKPDRVIVTNGKTISHAGIYEVALQKNIQVCTWDESPSGLGAFIFAFNDFANHYNYPKLWEVAKDMPLNDEESAQLERFFKLTEKGKFGRFDYYKNPVNDRKELFDKLKIDSNKKIITLLSNLTWDTSALGRDVAFESMFDWIFQTIDFCIENDDYELIIRCHPVEDKAPSDSLTAEKVPDVIEQKYPSLPDNIRVIKGMSEFNSHALSRNSDYICVYTTTVGLEMAMQGRNVLVSGDCHYRNKGFVTAIENKEQYLECLKNKNYEKNITEGQVELSRRYAYCFVKRSLTYLPEFHHDTRFKYTIEDPEAFDIGGSERWDNLCKDIEEVGIFMDTSPMIETWSSEGEKI